MTESRSKPEMFDNLRTMLRDVFKLRREGVAYARLARAHGYVDGYMRVLLETGVATREELLDVVATERAAADGPSTATLRASEEAAA